MAEELFIVDASINVSVSRDNYFNELKTLDSLRLGILFICNSVIKEENRLNAQNLPSKSLIFGNHPSVSPGFISLLPSFFHWFSISVINYARLVGYIVGVERGDINPSLITQRTHQENINRICKAYVASLNELNDVKIWRDKVSAHFAKTFPWNCDNIATLDASTMYSCGFENGRFKSNVVQLNISVDNVPQHSQIPSWSLTNVFESLIPRFWPRYAHPLK